MGAGRVAVLLAADGATWEAPALGVLGGASTHVLKRCVDLTDLIATAATGQADVAVVSGELPGLDADAVMHLLRHDVRCVAVGGDESVLARIGVVAVVPQTQVGTLVATVEQAGVRELVVDPSPAAPGSLPGGTGAGGGRVVVVHGPAGAPGRTTLALGLAAAHGRAGASAVLIDADPYGGAVAQHLGILDEVSGLLAAARLVNAGRLDAGSFARCARAVAPGFAVLTGLPRPDRWVEARAGVLDAVLEQSRGVGDTVVDTGFSLEDESDLGRSAARNRLTLDAVAAADHLVVVGSAEPTGLARLARTLVDLREASGAPVTVVVNRMRDSLGWSRRDVAGMVEGYARPVGTWFLPEDRPATDRALVAGRSVVEVGDSALARAVSQVHEAVLGSPAEVALSSTGRRAGRRAGRRQRPPMSR